MVRLDMEKAKTWLEGSSSVLAGHRYARLLRIVPAVALFMIIVYVLNNGGHHRLQTKPAADRPVAAPTSSESQIMAAASNATLGFGSIQFINLPGRYDRIDAATLQAHLSGIDIVEVQGVLAADIIESGMAPAHNPGRLQLGEKGCWRAHANIWNQMLRDKTPAVLVLESDVAWDVNVRPIMSNLNQHFTQLLDAVRSKAVPNPSFRGKEAWDAEKARRGAAAGTLEYSTDDPWHSTHWDLVSFGSCFEDPGHKDTSVRYPDPHVKPGKSYHDSPLGAERIVRQAGGVVCTTAYAISQTGAAKLLLRTAVDNDQPIDLIINNMVHAGGLVAYSVFPTVFAQWEYVDKIGKGGANSDIHTGAPAAPAPAAGNGTDTEGEQKQEKEEEEKKEEEKKEEEKKEEEKKEEEKVDLSGWNDVKKTGSIWQSKHDHPNHAFMNMALEKAWSILIPSKGLEELF